MTEAPKRPTPTEIADAADRFIDALDEAQAAIHRAWGILREFQPSGTYRSYPLFPMAGDALNTHLSKAQEELWAAHKPAAVQGYDNHRKVNRDSGLSPTS